MTGIKTGSTKKAGGGYGKLKDIKLRSKRPAKAKTKIATTTHIAVLLDQSGSMGRVRAATVAGFNEQVKTIRKTAGELPTTVSLTLFNGQVTFPFFTTGVDRLSDLTYDDYVPNGSTAMYDAISDTISRLQAETIDTPETAYLVIVVTDGRENDSKHTTMEELRRRVSELQATGRWTFAVIGSNIRLDDLSRETGILASNMRGLQTLGTDQAVAGAFASNSVGTERYMGLRTARSKGLHVNSSVADFYAPDDTTKI